MKLRESVALVALGLSLCPPAYAGASSFAIVNGAGADISTLAIRRAGSGRWLPLDARAPAGKATPINFSDPDCAFDLRATLADGATVTWSGVNLCDAKLLTLRRNAAGLAWVDYD